MVDSAPTSTKNSWLPYVPPGKNGRFPLGSATVWTGGLVVLFLLVVLTLVTVVPKIEARLARQTNTMLAEAGIDPTLLTFSWNYRDLSVHGELPPGVEVDQLATALNPLSDSGSVLFADGVRHLRMDVVKPVIPVKEELVIQRLDVRFSTDGKAATLDGTVQTHAQRELLVGSALLAGVETINDNLDVVVGNQATDAGDVKVEALARMLEKSGPQQVVAGQASLTTRNLTYRYTAKTRDAARGIEKAAELTMLDFVVIGEMEYLKHGAVEAQAISDGNEITLSGTVLSDAQRKRLRFAAADAVGSDNVIDVLTISGEEARLAGAGKRVDLMASALSLFRPGSSVTMQLAGKELSVDAVVENEADRVALLDVLRGFGESGSGDSGVTVIEKIRVLNVIENNPVNSLQRELDAYTQEIRKTIVFNSGETKLGSQARATLEKIALIINDYPELRIEVEGHTDNVGRTRVNDELSQLRANAVRDYLITQSVAADVLVAVGYGQRRPLESNDTIEGRRSNRRVHFSVLADVRNK